MSRSVTQIVILPGKTKVMILDTRRIPDGVTLYTISRWGEALNSDGPDPVKENVFVAKPSYPSTAARPRDGTKAERIRLLCNEKGKFRGLKPPGSKGNKKKRKANPAAVPVKKKKKVVKKKETVSAVVASAAPNDVPAVKASQPAAPKKRRVVRKKKKKKVPVKEPTLDELVSMVRGE